MDETRIDPTIAYDVVELPTKGIHYKNKNKSVRVAYLTASDENILSSPSLIGSGLVVDELLKRKILDKSLSIDEIVDEDRQAILIFLRNTAFGSEYTITVTDPKTNEPFTVDVDLSESKNEVSFTFLSLKQEKEIDEIRKSWNGNGVAPIITKQLEMMIKSVNGNKDLMNIRNLIETLPIKDSQNFRKFINQVKPGLDLTQNVTTPSGETIQVEIGFGVEFFRPFYGL